MSELAKKVAGTFIADEAVRLPGTLAWLTEECRHGRFAEALGKFCAAQPEMLDARLALVEQVTNDCIQGHIPSRCFDHESASTFPVEVRFSLNPRTGEAVRAS
jgi:hypothetical protein